MFGGTRVRNPIADSREMRSPRRRSATRRWRKFLTTMLVIGVFAAFGGVARHLEYPATSKSPEVREARAHALPVTSPVALRRARFNYSVIPGGVFDGEELTRAVERDPVVAEHYRNVDTATMRPQVLTSDRRAYVSYRRDDRLYWTSRKVLIRSGETILTNGQTETRARCGNCISMEPLLPTSADEPDEMQLDALTDTGPVIVSWPLNAFGLYPTGGPAGADVSTGLPTPTALTSPLFGFGPGGFLAGGVGGSPDGSPFGAATPPGVFPAAPPFAGTPPPGVGSPPLAGEVNPLLAGNPSAPGSPSGNTPELGPSVLAPLLDADSTQPGLPPPPPQPTVTPEPATLLLLGSGLAGLLARRWRARAN